MTDIVPAPDIPLSSEFPTGADRTAGVFNTKSAGWADTSRTMAAAMDAAAKSAKTNAIAANERAVAANLSADTATEQADAAMGYRNETRAARDQAVPAASVATDARDRAELAATSAGQDAIAVAAALAVAAGGPVATFNGRGGVVSLLSSDVVGVIPMATAAEMKAGQVTPPRTMSPSLVRDAILQLGGEASPVGTIHNGTQSPIVGTWLETGKTYLQASYPALFAQLGLRDDAIFGGRITNPAGAGAYADHFGANGNVLVGLSGTSSYGVIGRSADGGASWTTLAAPVSFACYGVVFGNGIFVAVGGSTTNGILTGNATGTSWVARSPSIAFSSGVAFGNGKFVAVAGTLVYSSLDGITWTQIGTIGASNVKAMKFLNGKFYALSQSVTAAGGMHSSPDGITWTSITMPFAGSWVGIAFRDGVYVAATSGRFDGSSFQAAAQLAYSLDGVNWFQTDLPQAASISSVNVSDGGFYLSASGGVYFSSDGLSWVRPGGLGQGAGPSVLAAGRISYPVSNMMASVLLRSYDPDTQFFAPKTDRRYSQWIKAA